MSLSTNSSLERQFNASLNFSNARAPQPQTLSSQLKITLCVVYSLIGVVTLLGNSLTIAAFMRKNFQRKRVHKILINLAITDLTLAAIPIPLQVLRLIKRPSMNLNTVHYFFDVLSGLTSMYSIAFVSLERLYAVCWPIRHRLLKTWHYTVAILMTWTIAGIIAVISSDIFTFRMKLISSLIVLHIRTVFSAVPICITVIAYCTLLVIRRCRKTTLGVQQHNRSIAFTLLIVTVIFVFTWCPFLIYSTTIAYLRRYSLCCPPWSIDTIVLTISLSKMLQYGNSCINPFIYTLRISAFRTAVWEILRCSERRTNVVIGSRENIITTSVSTSQMEMYARTSMNTRRKSGGRKNCSQVELKSNQAFSNLANEDQLKKYFDVGDIQLISFKRLNSIDRRHDNTPNICYLDDMWTITGIIAVISSDIFTFRMKHDGRVIASLWPVLPTVIDRYDSVDDKPIENVTLFGKSSIALKGELIFHLYQWGQGIFSNCTEIMEQSAGKSKDSDFFKFI